MLCPCGVLLLVSLGEIRVWTGAFLTTVLGGAILALLISLLIQLSISISGIQNRLRILAEESAKVQMRLRKLEDEHLEW
jgi:hypothetical protein